MYILDTKSKFGRMCFIYLMVTIFCLIFSFIYLKLSFGVVSYFMKYLFIVPLFLGVIVYFILDKIKLIKSYRLSFNLYNAAIVTLIVGSGIQGVLEICGAESSYTILYLIISILFILIAAINTLIRTFIKKEV